MKPGLVDRLSSVNLALWLLGILGAAMAVATIVPQRAPMEVYEHALGHLFGPLVYKSSFRDVYGSWWFIGAFGLLALSLLACSVRRARQLARQEQSEVVVERGQVRARPHWAEWRTKLDPEAAVAALGERLRQRGYALRAAQPGSEGARALSAQRGKLAAWGPVLIHIGMVVVLFGAAYGRLPAHSYREVVPLDQGQAYEAQSGEHVFSLRLLDAGTERDDEGRPTRFWARVEVLEEDKVVKSGLIEPNRPLRHLGVNMVLQTLSSAGYFVEATKGETTGFVPVELAPDGTVAMMETVRRLEDPPWVVFVHDFQPHGESGDAGPAARVFIDRSGQLSHSWERIGWVDEEGREFEGVRFRLVTGGQSAQLLLDRDIGVPFVWVGFCLAALGTVPLLGLRRRTIVALASARREGSSLLLGGSDAGTEEDVEQAVAAIDDGARKAEQGKTLIGS